MHRFLYTLATTGVVLRRQYLSLRLSKICPSFGTQVKGTSFESHRSVSTNLSHKAKRKSYGPEKGAKPQPQNFNKKSSPFKKNKIPHRLGRNQWRNETVEAEALSRVSDMMVNAPKSPLQNIKLKKRLKLPPKDWKRKFAGSDRTHAFNEKSKEYLAQGVVLENNEFRQAKKPVVEEIPRIAHGLDRVLFSPGVHFLQDPRTRIFNFTKYLEKIRPYDDFDASKFPGFVSASKDETLLKEAIKQNKTFYSSTSSMTLTLIQFYFLLNNYSTHPSSAHRFKFPRFTRNALRMPLCLLVEPKGVNSKGKTVYSVSSDKSTDVEILLLALGHCLEALLTTEENEFAHYLVKPLAGDKTASDAEPSSDDADKAANVYNYSSYGGFLMRSQLDCYDPRLPGNGTFDLKTRAACAIRYDQSPESAHTNYRISKLNGNIESFEREYNDLIKTGGLLKYGFQARIGQMDGIFIAYHSVNSFSGFQYLPLSEIDKVFYSDETVQNQIEVSYSAENVLANEGIASYVAESQFKVSLAIWEDVMKAIHKDFEGTEYEGMPYRLIFKRETSPVNNSRKLVALSPQTVSHLTVFAVPLTPEKLGKLQNFASQFKTSFRENLPQDERLLNLLEAERELNALNEDVIEGVKLFSYRVKASYHIKGANNTVPGPHPYPKRVGEGSEWRYTIEREAGTHRTEEEVRENYLDLMKTGAEVISMSTKMANSKSKGSDITQIVRKYGEVGRLRDERWNLENGKGDDAS